MQSKTVLVFGNFNILHPGHVRLLKFARECGDKLIVAVNADSTMSEKSHVSESHRLEVVKSLECVDDAFLTELSPNDLIHKYKPWAVVKGKEFESQYIPEKDALDKYGGKLIFGSGEFETSIDNFITDKTPIGQHFDYKELKEFAYRRDISASELIASFEKIKQLNVAVIGEVIVDEYVQGKAVGLSQEDPTIVMTPHHTSTFLGGAAITAGHIRSIGAKSVTLLSVLGDDEKATYVDKHIHMYDVNPYFCIDPSRPTPLKTRYRADQKTLLRVNQVRKHKISEELQNTLYDRLIRIIDDLDILVFSDFNYGVLPQKLVDRILTLCEERYVKVVADSQTSSQVGDISRYKGTHLLTPTEKEVRISLNNTDDGLVILAKKLCDISSPKNLVITLGSEGVFIHIPTVDGTSWENDRIPAINKNAIDPAGAGDCFLATSALFMAIGATPWQSFYVASIASACQVDNVGNIPLKSEVLFKAIQDSFVK